MTRGKEGSGFIVLEMKFVGKESKGGECDVFDEDEDAEEGKGDFFDEDDGVHKGFTT